LLFQIPFLTAVDVVQDEYSPESRWMNGDSSGMEILRIESNMLWVEVEVAILVISMLKQGEK
jgi:hypothetical protein